LDKPEITMVELSKIFMTDRRTVSLYTNKLRKYWCPFVQSNGKCDHKCSTGFCASHVLEIVSKIFDTARSKEAVLLFRIRNEKARVAEELSRQEKEPIQLTILGEVRTENIFNQMMARR
jgi:hypothetical protein